MPDTKSELILYKLDGSPPSNSVMILGELIGLQITGKDVDLLNMKHKSEEFKKINPMGTLPALADGEYCISESHAIMKYLLEEYGTGDQKEALYPSDPKTRGMVDQVMFFDTGVLFIRVKDISLGAIFQGAKCPTEKQRQAVEDAYYVLEAYLQNSYLACDHMTLADIGAATTTNALQVSHRLDENKFPRTVNWLARMNEHALFKKINVPGLAMYTHVMKSCWEKNQQADT
ncbi:glutathione S-transferase 1-like [Aricia agestis]|uniref:glutathione S-transferase 1-like n=1 Tax=Aricia agestis TaxID=91739 RepID=UPI001C201D36|nr:glutathione S-transferase 1-like [Aricia agestis]